MKKRNIQILLVVLTLSLFITSCSNKTDKSDLEQNMEEQIVEENTERIMKEFNNLVTSADKDMEAIIDFVKKNIEQVGKVNGDRMILQLEEIVKEKQEETENNLIELDKKNEIKKLSGEEVILLESKVRDVKDPDLRKALQNAYKKPYKVVYFNGKGIKVLVDYDKMLKYTDNISEGLESYLSLMAVEINNPMILDGEIIISYEDFEKRLIKLEKFLIETGYSEKYEDIMSIYRDSLITYLKGTEKSITYDEESLKIDDQLFKSYERLSKNKDDVTPYVIRRYINILEDRDRVIDESIDKDILSIVNEALNGIETKRRNQI